MKQDTEYLITIGGISFLTAIVIYSVPLALILEITKICCLQIHIGFIFTFPFVVIGIVHYTFEPLMNKLLIFYGGARFKRILETEMRGE